MKQNYFLELWRKDRLVFLLIIFFVSAQLFFTVMGVETFPFVHWGMYSEIQHPKNDFTVYKVIAGNESVKLSGMIDCKKSLVTHSLEKYDELVSSSFREKEEAVISKRATLTGNENFLRSKILNDSVQVKKYPLWLLQYLADMRLLQQPKIEIQKMNVRYENGNFITDTTENVIGFYEYRQ